MGSKHTPCDSVCTWICSDGHPFFGVELEAQGQGVIFFQLGSRIRTNYGMTVMCMVRRDLICARRARFR